MMRPKRVLITGLNSFTGYYLEKELTASGWEVWGTGLAASSDLPRYEQVNLADTQRLQFVVEKVKPTAVVHLAAISFVATEDINCIYEVNLLGTRNLLAALSSLSALPDKVLLASSAQVYGRGHSGVLKENVEKHPANDYAISKLSMELMAQTWKERLPIVITRPFNYTGVGQAEHFLIPKIVKHFRGKAPIIELGNLDVWRDFSDVRSVVDIYARLLETPTAAGETVNICSGETYSLREILQKCRTISDHELEVKVNPDFVRTNEVKTLSGDIDKLKLLLGNWKKIPFEETLEWMLKTTPSE